MNENTQVAVVPSLAPMISVPSGKGFKQVQSFGRGSAKTIKTSLVEANPELKGKALTKAVNSVLTGEKSLREQLGVAFVQACIQNGKIPDRGEVTKNGAKLIFVNAVEPKEESMDEKLNAMSADEVADMIHKLEALLDSKVEAMEKAS
jgi:hypothetical protein